MKIIRLLLIATILWSADFPLFSQEKEIPFNQLRDFQRKIVENIEKSVLFIMVESDDSVSMGSGFIVADGYVLTNGHVVNEREQEGRIYILNKYMKAVEADIVDYQYEDNFNIPGSRDLALLRFDPPENTDMSPMIFNLEIKRLDKVSAWGYPGLVRDAALNYGKIVHRNVDSIIPLPVASTTGNVNAIVQGKLGSMIVHSAQISSGNSGGPLVNSKGEVVGINTWAYNIRRKNARANLAQPAEDIVAFLYSNKINPKLAENQYLPSKNNKPATSIRDKMNSLPADPPEKEYNELKPGKIPGNEQRIVEIKLISFLIPEGWRLKNKYDNSILIASADDKSFFMIVADENSVLSLEQIAKVYSDSVNGSVPSPFHEGLSFNFTMDGTSALGVVNKIGDDKHLMYCIISNSDNIDLNIFLNNITLKR
ncbi:MAG: serine protease [Deltaproteobacteria bacterium]|jgi:V8-like Glu-specific endopeptidase|nr:serine protease [Deltaproteobacteria bacterium]